MNEEDMKTLFNNDKSNNIDTISEDTFNDFMEDVFLKFNDFSKKKFNSTAKNIDTEVFKQLVKDTIYLSNGCSDGYVELLNTIFITQIILEAKEVNYSNKNKTKLLQSKANQLEDVYKLLKEFEILGVKNQSLKTIKNIRSEISKVLLDVVCIKDNVKEISNDRYLSLDYDLEPYTNLKQTSTTTLKPYIKETFNKKVFDDDYGDYINTITNKAITKEDILKLSSIEFDKNLNIYFKDYPKKREFIIKVYKSFFNASKSLIINKNRNLKYHSITVSIIGHPKRTLNAKLTSTSKSITLQH